MSALLLAVALASAGVGSDAVYRDGTNRIRLRTSRCANAQVVDQIKTEWQERFKTAIVSNGPAHVDACWILRPNGMVHVIFEDGSALEVPAVAFNIERGP